MPKYIIHRILQTVNFKTSLCSAYTYACIDLYRHINIIMYICNILRCLHEFLALGCQGV